MCIIVLIITIIITYLDVDCKWSEFGDWTYCSATCGIGTKTRSRTIETEAIGNGTPCDGEEIEEKECNEGACSEGGPNFI